MLGFTAIGVVLALVGPFGTYESMDLLPRLGYWALVVVLNGVLCDLIIRRVDDQLPATVPLRRVVVPVTGAILASVPATSVVAVSNRLFGLGWPENLAVLFVQVLLLVIVISLLVYALLDLKAIADETVHASSEAQKDSDLEPDPMGGDDSWSRFQSRLPESLDGQLLCLEMHDHYLAVHTTAGKCLILCRMDDAARELDDLGLRVHRSWWVATDAVEKLEKQGQRWWLRLSDHRRVPVGRTYRPAIREAGWQ